MKAKRKVLPLPAPLPAKKALTDSDYERVADAITTPAKLPPAPPPITRDSASYKRLPLKPPVTSGQCRIPESVSPDILLSAAPMDIGEMAGYFYDMSKAQLMRCWVGCCVNALVEDLVSRDLVGRKEAAGIYRGFSECLVIVRARLIEGQDK